MIGRKGSWKRVQAGSWSVETVLSLSGLRQTPYSDVAEPVLPPTFLVAQHLDTVELGIPDAPVRLNGGNRCQWLRSVHVGEQVERRSGVVDVKRKSGQSGELVIYRTETEYRTVEPLEVVARSWNVAVRRYPIARERKGGEGGSDHTKAAGAGERTTAAGQEMFRVTPSTRDLVRYAAATGDFYEAHYDQEFARDHGLPGIIVHGLLKLAWLARGVLGYCGPGSFIREIEASYRGLDQVGEPFTVFCGAGDDVASSGNLIAVRTYGVSGDGRVSTFGSAVVEVASGAKAASKRSR